MNVFIKMFTKCQVAYITKYSNMIHFVPGNFSEHEIGEPIFDKVLEPGDCMYFPRGYIHQANTLDESHSLHITLSVYQRTSWGDFLEKV